MPKPRKIAYSGVYFLSALTPEVFPYIVRARNYKEIVAAEQTDSELRPLTCSADRSGYVIYQSKNEIFTIPIGRSADLQ
jgi:hypothetical protein